MGPGPSVRSEKANTSICRRARRETARMERRRLCLAAARRSVVGHDMNTIDTPFYCNAIESLG